MRIALGIEYQGGAYRGWQKQADVPSVQKYVEAALENILRHEVHITCAGRTDAGVNATGQVVHFDTDLERPIKAYDRGLNTKMPHDIAITWAKQMPDDFHARFSAIERRYRYIIYNSPLRPGILNTGITHVYQPLDADLMHQAAQCLVGKNDFTTFRASLCQAKSPVRTVKSVSVHRQGRYLIVDILANAFLHHMVRNIVGSLLVIGQGEQPVEWMAQLLAQKDRKLAATTAKPNGLYLVKVVYAEPFELPEIPTGPLFLDN